MRRHRLLALLAALAILLSACGGDDGDSSAERDITDVAGGDDSGDSGDSDDSGDEGSDDGGDALAAFTSDECGDLYQGLAGAAAAFGGTGPDGGDLTDAAEYFEQVADDVPNEIEADFRIFAEAYTAFAEAAEDAGIDFSDPDTMTPEALEKLGEAASAFEEAEVQEASERISEFAEEACGTADGQ